MELSINTEFLKQLKHKILQSRYLAAKLVNAEMLNLYFAVGRMLNTEIEKQNWEAKVLETISARLQQELPGLRGFSAASLRKMRIFYDAWQHSNIICPSLSDKIDYSDNQPDIICSSATNKLDNSLICSLLTNKFESETDAILYLINCFKSTSFSLHYEILTSLNTETERWYYIQHTATEFWSVRTLRNHLRNHLRNKSNLKTGTLPNNFNKTLQQELSNKAIQSFKDEYLLDCINIEDPDEEPDECVLESEIVLNIKKFLMSLGSEFSFMGNQYRLIVEEEEFFIDLLFYHRKLQALVAFELKKGRFIAEYAGKMNFYLSALDDLVKLPHENPSIGIILCKEKKNKTVEYSFRDVNKPMGVATYSTSRELPEKYKDLLPKPEELAQMI